MRKNTSKKARAPEKRRKKTETSGRTFKRAHAVIAEHRRGTGRYDQDTCDAICRAIAENSPNLTELVKRAESGETILDITQPPAGQEQTERVADALSELLYNPATPARLFNAVAEYYAVATSDEGLHKAVFWQPDCLRKLIALQNQEASHVS